VTANPKKGAILGVMLVVAIYFWVPLVAGWIGKSQTGQSAPPNDAGATALAGFPTLPAAGDKPGPSAQAETPWYVLAEWMNRDPLKLAAGPHGGGRDPFRFIVHVEKPKAPPPESKKKPIVAQSVPLKLSGTLVGPQRRLATINGRTYRQGDEVKLTADGQTAVFKLTEIHPQRVVVTYEGRPLELKIRVPATTNEIQLMGKND
jgi:hypothetical protein